MLVVLEAVALREAHQGVALVLVALEILQALPQVRAIMVVLGDFLLLADLQVVVVGVLLRLGVMHNLPRPLPLDIAVQAQHPLFLVPL